MAKIKKLGVLSFAKFQGVILSAVGLMAGILYAFGGLIIDILVNIGWLSSAAAETPGMSCGTVLAFGALIGMPLIAGAVGFAAGIIQAILYNLIARSFGGLVLEYEE